MIGKRSIVLTYSINKMAADDGIKDMLWIPLKG